MDRRCVVTLSTNRSVCHLVLSLIVNYDWKSLLSSRSYMRIRVWPSMNLSSIGWDEGLWSMVTWCVRMLCSTINDRILGSMVTCMTVTVIEDYGDYSLVSIVRGSSSYVIMTNFIILLKMTNFECIWMWNIIWLLTRHISLCNQTWLSEFKLKIYVELHLKSYAGINLNMII